MINKLLLKGDKCEVQCTMEECTVEQCTMEQSTMEQYKKFAFSFAPEGKDIESCKYIVI